MFRHNSLILNCAFFEVNMNINWYPGHMKKSLDKIREIIKTVDIVCEIVDARIPISSRNPVLNDIIGNFPRLILFNKIDMANPFETKRWVDYFNKQGIKVLEFNSLKDRKTAKLYNLAREILKDKFEMRLEKNIVNETIKMMVVGIPNVGKSTFINNISKRKGTKVGNKPGVTRTNQWIKTDSNLLLLDTPGVLWPKLDTVDGGQNLAFTGAIKDETLNIEDLCFNFINLLKKISSKSLEERYGVDIEMQTVDIMDFIAKKSGAILKGNEIDYFKVSNIIFDDFRKLRIDRITLETVDQL